MIEEHFQVSNNSIDNAVMSEYEFGDIDTAEYDLLIEEFQSDYKSVKSVFYCFCTSGFYKSEPLYSVWQPPKTSIDLVLI